MNRAALVLLSVSCAAACRSRDPPPSATRVSTLDSLVALGEEIYRREEYEFITAQVVREYLEVLAVADHL